MKPPVLRAMSKDERGVRVSWFELFYDLVVVASVSHGSHLYVEHPSWGMGTWLAASLVMLMTFWLLTMVSHNLYPGDDIGRRFLVIVQMVALVVASLSLGRGEEGLPNSVGFAALAICFASISLVYWRCGRQYPDTSGVARLLAPTSLLAAVIMGVGALLPSNGEVISNPITWAFTIGMLCGIVPLVFIVLNHRTTTEQINAEHLGERMGQLVLIVLGESFVSLIFSLDGLSEIPNPWYFLLDFIVVLAIWTLYFTGVVPAGVPATAARLRLWLAMHVVFIFGAIATAGGLAALTLIPFRDAPATHGFWTPLPLFYVMLGLLGLSILARRPRVVLMSDAVIVALLAVLTALALWVIPAEAQWLTLAGAALVIVDAALSAFASRRQSNS